jgi:hypothetical protein
MGNVEGARFLSRLACVGAVFVLRDGAVRLVGHLEVDADA